MRDKFWRTLFLVPVTALLSIAMSGCSGGGPPNEIGGIGIVGTGKPITVKGVVLGGAGKLENVCVFLLDNQDKYISKPSNSDGEFKLTIPAGTLAYLLADDCDDPMSPDGKYYPAINVYGMTGPDYFEEDTEGWPVHVSENADEDPNGALAVYENYFENATQDEDFYDPINSVYDDYGGFIFLSTYWVDTNSMTFFENVDDQTVELSDDKCPVGYLSYDDTTNDQGALSPDDGPNILQPGGGTGTDFSAAILSFCKKGAAHNVDLTLNSPHHHKKKYEFTIPIRPNSCTLIFPASIDGEDVPFEDVLVLFGVI